MSTTLDLDDVAATSPTAQAELAELRTRLRDASRFASAVECLFAVLPDEYHAAHLSIRARDLRQGIDRVLPKNAEPSEPANG